MVTLGEIEGFLVGHSADLTAETGCTVILCPQGAVASAYTPGFAPGSRETELLRPEGMVEIIHGLILTGGSAFGLAAADGVVRFLREKGLGLATPYQKVPCVAGAVIYDYPGNKSKGTLPDALMGYRACQAAESGPVESGPAGVGTSAESGKLGGRDLSSPSGLGSFGVKTGDGLIMTALAAVNPLGSIVSPNTGAIISGLKTPKGNLATRTEILETLNSLAENNHPGQTVLVAVGTNARINKLDAYRLAKMAGCGLARAVFPAHLLFDGDTVFALSTATGPTKDISYLGALAAEVVSEAIVRSVPQSLNKAE
ncbi:MAG: P1 family peptidase [Deltaproteobacteria bacterium]|jgi:L-aminopeptidase/D-esterase-like protein|nr:P1 family peptidase [Deltaproteobacteria bacterium]